MNAWTSVSWGVCLLALGMAACDGSASRPPTEAEQTLVGRWASEPTLSQLGRIVHEYEFRADGTFSCSFTFVDAKLPKAEKRGTWSGRSLSFDSGSKSSGMTYEFEGETLLLREGNGDTYRLRRR